MKKMVKQLSAAILIFTLVFTLGACGSKDEKQEAKAKDYSKASIEEIKKDLKTVTEGKLTVATSPDFAPYEFYTIDDKGEYHLAGFDMDLAKYIAKYLDLKLEVVPMDFDGTLEELATKSVDLALAGYSPDPARKEKMDFSDIYYAGGQSFCTNKANESLFKSLKDTNKSKYKIAAQNGSVQMELAKEHSSKADVISLQKVTDIIAELVSGKIDGAYIETAVAETYAKNYPELVIKFDVPYDTKGSAVGVSKGNAALLAGVNMAIKEAKKDGSLDKFIKEANDKAINSKIHEGLVKK